MIGGAPEAPHLQNGMDRHQAPVSSAAGVARRLLGAAPEGASMKNENIWRLPATLFLVGTLAMLLAGAWRELEAPAQATPVISLPEAAEQPQTGEAQSNEIVDYPQLD